MPTKIQSEGSQSAKIMVVGEAPGREEELEGRPFVGYAGRTLRAQLMAAGINPTQVFYANICRYKPPANELRTYFDKDGVPNDLVAEGLMELKDEIEAIKPNVIVALGNYPLWALTGKAKWNRKDGYTGIGDWRGSIVQGRDILTGGRKIVCANHPSAINRKYSLLQTFDLDLKRVREQSAFPDIKPLNKEYIIDPQGEERIRIRDWLLNEGTTITFDIEFIRNELLCVGMTNDKDKTAVIRTRNATDIAFVRDILLSGKPLCAQNGMFDCSVLEYWYRMPLIKLLKHDTMLASHAAYIELPKDLGFLCSVYTEQPCYWTNIDWKAVSADRGIADQVDFMTYCGIDTWVTHDVMEQQLADELTDPNVRKAFDFEMSLLEPLWEISRKGMRVSKEKMELVKISCEEAIKLKGDQLEVLAGVPVNVMSGAQVGKFLNGQLGLPILAKTPTGQAKWDDYTLADLDLVAKTEMQKGAIAIIRDIRKNRSLISKFVDITYDADGRMRCHYNPAGTVTGRLSSRAFYPTRTGANLQNIPRDKRVRSVFVPDPGKIFFYNDLERAESLVVAHLSGDPIMLAKHAPGKDAHRITASLLFGKPEAEITDLERYLGKQTGHAGNYMEGWKTLQKQINKNAATTGVSIDAKTAKYLINTYREAHYMLPVWWRDTEYKLRQTRTLYNLLGRPRKFYDRLDSCLPTAIAYVPQSTIGDVLNVALLKCYNDPILRELGVEILVQVHDAIGGQVPEANVHEAMARMRKLMRVDLVVPKTQETFDIPVEIAFGPSWGECQRWEGDLDATHSS